jgi:hypothetical protein
METAMNTTRCTLVGGAMMALASLVSPATSAADPANAAAADTAQIVVAQAATPVRAIDSTVALDEHPAYQRGVRKAAAEGNEALRRYVWRTRMIYNFYYNDFALRE